MITKRLRRACAHYYLSFRIGAALAVPNLGGLEIPVPTPIVRQYPGRIRGEWDERELIHGEDADWIVVQEAGRLESTPFSWN